MKQMPDEIQIMETFFAGGRLADKGGGVFKNQTHQGTDSTGESLENCGSFLLVDRGGNRVAWRAWL